MIEKTEKAHGILRRRKKYNSERDNFGRRNYALWEDFMQNMQISSGCKREQKTAYEWYCANKNLIKFLNNEQRIVLPNMYRAVTNFDYLKKTSAQQKPFAGAWYGVAIN